MIEALWAFSSAALSAILGFPFLVGLKRPARFGAIVSFYATAFCAIYLLAFGAEVFYQLGQFRVLSHGTGVADPDKIEGLIFNGWQYIYLAACVAYLGVLWVFGRFIVAES
ncbi:hypothetical protein LAZ40_13235 [Cereibacter sphaeroides]|uniref:hypothetical protein n=1 Tax=Cereibacter sphaeroides TaxID=1063 RepID=UPI001F3D7316|nr:hypothetical protein [Cereibacter sphaeroides]MCE6959985.1 hypothetical protein [Cereibacter sphaeroides]MCE6973070.1 hypothetical protein [Cereibacter sphaeroides]